jgi:hypothetical protein
MSLSSLIKKLLADFFFALSSASLGVVSALTRASFVVSSDMNPTTFSYSSVTLFSSSSTCPSFACKKSPSAFKMRASISVI